MKTFVTLFLLVVIGCVGRTQVEIDNAINSGNSVIAAVEQHRIKHGKPPSDLSNLVPNFLIKVPVYAWGKVKWRYKVVNDFDYQLTATEDDDSFCLYYLSRTKTWSVDTG